MNNAVCVISVWVLSLFVLGCGGDDSTTTGTTTTTTDESTGGEPAPAAPWEPASCTVYGYTPTDCQGSAENPNCHQEFTLHPGGRAELLFDDIVMDGSYRVEGTVVRVEGEDYGATYTLEGEGAALIDANGNRFVASACP